MFLLIIDLYFVLQFSLLIHTYGGILELLIHVGARVRACTLQVVVPSASAIYGCVRGRGLKFRACLLLSPYGPPTLILLPMPMVQA